MNNKGISPHLLRVYDAVDAAGEWITTKQIAKVSGVAERTARAHAQYLTGCSLFEVIKFYDGYCYRVTDETRNRNGALLLRFATAKKAYFSAVG